MSTTTNNILLHHAHAARNNLATLRAVEQLIDEKEVKDALKDAAVELQKLFERAVICARIDENTLDETEQMSVDTLIEYAQKRAIREGETKSRINVLQPIETLVPTRPAERLFTDLLHFANEDIQIKEHPKNGIEASLSCSLDIQEKYGDYLQLLAQKCAITLHIS